MEWSQFQNFKRYQGKMILSIDYGTKVTGLATFCPGKDPYPLAYGKIVYKNDQNLVEELALIINDECVEVLILGLPLFLDGKESEMTSRVKNFALKLKENFPTLELQLQDETLTSFEAKERMKNSPEYNFQIDPKKIDTLSAVIILEDFIRKT